MRSIRIALAALAVGAFALLSATPAGAGDGQPQPQTFTEPCSHGDVKCDGESSGDAPEGAWCSFDHDGDSSTPALEGHVDKHGRCVCATVPTTTSTSTTSSTSTSTTVAPTTSTTVAPTTTSTAPAPSATVVSPSTTVGQPAPSTTVVQAAPTTRPFVRPLPAAQPASSGQLPRTGNNTGPMVATGIGLIALGGALAYAARRRLAAG